MTACLMTKEVRREACVHEAAHAVIAALAGASVFRVAVAPEGGSEWAYESRRGAISTDVWGMCELLGENPLWLLDWDDDNGYCVKKELIASYPVELLAEFKATMRRSARANICHLLAGPAASQILEGEDVFLYEGNYTQRDDISKAIGLAQLLHWRGEYEHLASLTEQMLRKPDVWRMVLSLADRLEQTGEMDMDELAGFLPKPIQNWPPSVRQQQAAAMPKEYEE